MIELPSAAARYVGDPARDELRDARQDAERRVYARKRDILRKLGFGVSRRDLYREFRALRDAVADLDLVALLEGALDELDADDDQEMER